MKTILIMTLTTITLMNTSLAGSCSRNFRKGTSKLKVATKYYNNAEAKYDSADEMLADENFQVALELADNALELALEASDRASTAEYYTEDLEEDCLDEGFPIDIEAMFDLIDNVGQVVDDSEELGEEAEELVEYIKYRMAGGEEL